MTPLGPPTWPPPRSLAQWWNDLAGRQPHRLWYCHWPCHRLEARVEVACSFALDPLSLAVLRQFCRGPAASFSPESLGLEPALLHRLLHELSFLGLAQQADGWQPTAAGLEAARTGSVSHRCRRRRVFYFLDRAEEQQPPHYLPLQSGKPALGPVTGGLLPAGCLDECVHHSPDWKERFQFPADVLAVLPPAGPEDWQGVLVDFPETWLVVLIETGTGEDRSWFGFRVQPGSWQLLGPEPVLRLGRGWEEVFPELERDAPLASWRQEWLRWSQPHSIPPAEIEACVLYRQGHRLVVQAPRRMVERYRSGPRAEALRHEGWLLAGEGRTRSAGQIELVEAKDG